MRQFGGVSVTITDYLLNIDQNPIFSGVSTTVLQQFFSANTVKRKDFLPEELIHSSQSGEIRIGIVLQGSARVHAANNDRSLLRTMQRGNMFGIANLYAKEEPFPSMIIAAEPCQVLFLDSDAFCQLIEHDPTALRNYLAFQSKKIVYLNRKIMTFTAGSAEKKLALFLLENEVDGAVRLPCSMSRLSELLCIGRASLYRALDHLEERNLIQKQEKSLQILNRSALAEI